MIDFVEFYAKQVFYRRIFLITSIVFFILMVLCLIAWLTSPMPKTTEDYLKEYIQMRYSYTPDLVRNAYYNKLQYKPLVYDELVRSEINEVIRMGLFVCFVPTKFEKDGKDLYKVKGRKTVFRRKTENTADIVFDGEVIYTIGVKDKKFFEK